MRRREWLRLGAALSVAALVAAGCGDDDEDATTATTEGESSATTGATPAACDSPGVTDDEIVVGAQISLTGTGAQIWAQALPGIEARFAQQNADGGVGGRQLRLEVGDDASDQQRGEQTARELIEGKDAFGLILNSQVSDPQGPYLEEAGIPVAGWPVTPAYGKHRNYFGYSGSSASDPSKVTSTVSGEFFESKGVTKLGVLAYNLASMRAAGENYGFVFKHVTGNDAVVFADAPVGSADWGVEAQKLKEAGIDGLYLPIGIQDAANAYEAALQAGVELKAVQFPAGYGPVALEQLGDRIEGATFSIDFAPYQLELPAHQVVLDALEEYAPDADVSNGMTSQPTTTGWLSADLFIRGLQEAGEECPTREAFIENLRKVTDYDGGGLLLEEIDFEESWDKPWTCFYYVTVTDGEFVPEEDQPFCGELLER